MEHRPGEARRGEDAVELGPYALGGYGGERGGCGVEGRLGGRLHHEAEPAGEAHRAQHAQGVLAEARRRIAHAADHAGRKVILAAIGVQQATAGMVGHGVDREVTAREVLADVVHEGDGVRMAQVGVGALHAKRRDLDGGALDDAGHGAVGRARLVHGDARRRAGGLRLLPSQAATHVHVVVGRAAQRVAHPAAHDPRFAAGALEDLDEAKRGARQLGHPRHEAPFPISAPRDAKRDPRGE